MMVRKSNMSGHRAVKVVGTSLPPQKYRFVGAETPRLPRFARGFTLVELLVVITILVILTSVAVSSLEGMQDQSRYDSTKRSLQNIQDAVLGASDAREPDGTPIVNGFVADMGRLPVAITVSPQLVNDPKVQLQELWRNQPDGHPRHMLPFAIRWTPHDPEVRIGTGWRGPYLRLGVVESDLRDHWGGSLDSNIPDSLKGGYDLLPGTENPAIQSAYIADGQPVEIVRCVGGDRVLGGADINADSFVYFSSRVQPVIDQYHVSISGSVFIPSDDGSGGLRNPNSVSGSVMVVLFEPDPATGGIRTQGSVFTPAGAVNYAFGSTIGPRAVRAYQSTAFTADVAANMNLLSAALRKSIPTRVVLRQGGQTKDLVLR